MSDILNDIGPAKSADIDKPMKADEKITIVELARSERLGIRVVNGGKRTKIDS